MKIKPLTQLREMISKPLSGQTNISKSFQSFFIETMELMLTHTGRLNFTLILISEEEIESLYNAINLDKIREALNQVSNTEDLFK